MICERQKRLCFLIDCESLSVLLIEPAMASFKLNSIKVELS